MAKLYIPYADSVEKLLADMAALNQHLTAIETTRTPRRTS
jgi:hypothetical protein